MDITFETVRPDIILPLAIFAISIALLTSTLRGWISDRRLKKTWEINNE